MPYAIVIEKAETNCSAYVADSPGCIARQGTAAADRFDLLALVIEEYERRRWPIEPPDPVDAIRSASKNGKQQPVPPAGRS